MEQSSSSAHQPALDAFLQSRCGYSLSELLAATPDWLEKRRSRGTEHASFREAIKDFQTVVLNTGLIRDEEPHLRCELLALIQFMPSRYLDTAMHGSDTNFTELSGDAESRRAPWFLILRLLRATRIPASSTETCRLKFYCYPDQYVGEAQDQFRNLVDSIRKNSDGHYIGSSTR